MEQNAMKIHVVTIFWNEDNQEHEVHYYFSSKKKATKYLEHRKELFDMYANPLGKNMYYHDEKINEWDVK
jgi:hypothetical protein